MFVDGETAYCIQPGRHLLVNDTLYKSSSAAWNALSVGQRKAIGLALLYGYQGNWSNLSGSDDEKWVATAEIIWEFVTGCRESSPPYRQVSTAIYDIQFGSNQPNYGTKAVYDLPYVTAKGGKLIYSAMYPNDFEMPLNLYKFCYYNELTITGMYVAPYAFPRAAQMLPELDLAPLTTKVFELEDAVAAFDAQVSGKYPKILIRCNKDLE